MPVFVVGFPLIIPRRQYISLSMGLEQVSVKVRFQYTQERQNANAKVPLNYHFDRIRVPFCFFNDASHGDSPSFVSIPHLSTLTTTRPLPTTMSSAQTKAFALRSVTITTGLRPNAVSLPEQSVFLHLFRLSSLADFVYSHG